MPDQAAALTHAVAVTRTPTGRLEVFGVGTNKALWHIWQRRRHTRHHGRRGPRSAAVSRSEPAAIDNSDGRLEVFVRGTDNALWHIWQTVPHAGRGRTGPRSAAASPAIRRPRSNTDGRLEVFARGTDNALWHIWQTAPHTGPWSVHGLRSAAIITSDPAVAVNSDGRLEVFARGTDNALWHIWQTAPHTGRGRAGLRSAAASPAIRRCSSTPMAGSKCSRAAPTMRCGTSGSCPACRPVVGLGLAGRQVITSDPAVVDQFRRPAGGVRARHRRRAVAHLAAGAAYRPMVGLGLARRRHHQRSGRDRQYATGGSKCSRAAPTTRCGTSGRRRRMRDLSGWASLGGS